MIELKFSTICLQCPYITVTSDIKILHSDGAPFTATGYISCEQREMCKWYNKKSEVMDPIKKKFNKNNSDKIIDVYKFNDYLTVVMLCKTEFTDEECVAINFKIKEINTPESAMDINPKTIDSIMEKLKLW